MTFLKWILSFFGGKAFEAIVNAYKAKLEAAGKQDTLAVELAAKEIEGAIEARRTERDIIIAEQGRWWTALPRPLIAFAIAIFIWKVVVWDKVLGLGVTDPLDPKMWEAFTIVLTAYFGGRSIEKVAQVFRGRR